ncbi:MAG: hypothetical protein HY000_35905 [Planctomycetes bacterium]|nr:hypothetical protein [Planctomycetota bacterium]
MIRITVVNRGPRHDAAPLVPQLIDRLNHLNPRAITYRLAGDILRCDVHNAALLQEFDRDMMRYIGARQGGVDAPGGDHEIPIRVVARTREFVDAHALGTVDLVDLLDASDFSFCSNVLHILEERWQTPDYQRRRVVFNRPHREAINQEVEYLRGVLGDPTLRFIGEYDRASSVYVVAFQTDGGLRVEHVFTTRGDVATESELYVIQGRQRRTLREFVLPRAAAVPPAAAPPPAAAR